MTRPPSSSNSGSTRPQTRRPAGHQQSRLRQGSQREKNDASSSSRVRARRPPTIDVDNEEMSSVDDSEFAGSQSEEVQVSYEEVVATAAAVVDGGDENGIDDDDGATVNEDTTTDNIIPLETSPPTGDGVASGSIRESHGEHSSGGSIENNAGSNNINPFDLLIDEAISNDSGSEHGGDGDDSNDDSSGSDECSSIGNRFDLLMDDENSNMSDEGSDSDGSFKSDEDPDSNRFNELMDDDSDSSSEDDDDNDDDNSDLSLPELEDIVCSTSTNKTCNLVVSSEDEDSMDFCDDDDDAAKCAVCFLPDNQSHKWRRLLTLPCCGLNGKEQSSSTRFCAACILQMAMTSPDDPTISNEYHSRDHHDEVSDAPVRQFYRDDVQTERRRIIECPRCRDILVVNIKKNDKSDNTNTGIESNGDGDSSSCGCDCSDCRPNKNRSIDWTDPKNARSVSVRTPSFKERCRYAGKKVGVARILWRAAFLHHGFMPSLALGSDSEEPDIRRLVGWGILHRVSPNKKKVDSDVDVYRMNRPDQMELIKLLGLPMLHITEDYGKNDYLIPELLARLGMAAGTSLRKFRLDRVWRLMNRLGLLILFFKGYLPPYPLSLWQEWVVTALNVFALTMIVQFVCVAVLYAGTFFGVILSTTFFLRCSRTQPIGWQLVLLYLAYRAQDFVCNSPCIAWFGHDVPNATVTVKELIWELALSR